MLGSLKGMPVVQGERSFLAAPKVSGKRAAKRQARQLAARAAADRPLWFPDAEAPGYLDGSMAGDYGWDPLGLGANPDLLDYYRQGELVNGRWAMLGVAGILGQEIFRPNQFWYTAGLPENLPNLYFGGDGDVNLGGLLAWEFLLMHWVEVRRFQDIKKHHSVDEDPIFKGNKVPNEEKGYPGGIFDPFGFSKGDKKELQTKEIKNGRLAMVAFVGFTLQAQSTGLGPLASAQAHISDPFRNNILTNIGQCHIQDHVTVQGLDIPLVCLWPGTRV